MTRMRLTRTERQRRAAPLFADHDGVAHRRDLRQVGVSRDDVRSEVTAGRWSTRGRYTVQLGNGPLEGRPALWRAVWESGSGAVLDGACALVAGGMTGFEPTRIDVALPRQCHPRDVDGVRPHLRRELGPVAAAGIPRTRPEAAAIRAAQWAVSDRQAALLLCLPLQQRLVSPVRLMSAWAAVGRSRRRALIDSVVRDLCDGAHSLGELDFASECRRRGIPEPTRQVVRHTRRGRIYLDVRWDHLRLVVEVDGGHHAMALMPIDDALRQNEVTLSGDVVLRIPVIGLRLTPEAFLDQVARAVSTLSARAA